MSSRLNARSARPRAGGALDAAAFRALVRSKGHSLASLARLWGLTRARLSQIAADPARAPHYVFALWGTPRRRSRALAGAGRHDEGVLSARATELEIGEVFVVEASPGEHLPEGEEGVVVRLVAAREGWQAQLRFAAVDYTERFAVSYLLSAACFLVRTGRVRPGLA